MAVLIEAISVVVHGAAMEAKYSGGWDAFKAASPNDTLCADGELIRVGFLQRAEAEAFVEHLKQAGLVFLERGRAKDIALVDHFKGLVAPCDWLQIGHLNLDNDPTRRVMAARLQGSESNEIAMPDGWDYAHSLTHRLALVVSTGRVSNA